MNGIVDDNSRALLQVGVRATSGDTPVKIETWVDTAFDGHFVFPSHLIKELSLETLVETEAILADGSKVALQTYVCFIEWFGKTMAAQVVENEGRFPLLGTALLSKRKLTIDCDAKSVELT